MPWNSEDLDRISQTDVVHISSYRQDGSQRRPVPIWIVRVADDLYVRSAYGTSGGWYHRALASPLAHLDAAGTAADVRLEPVTDEGTRQAVAAAYRSKYHSQAASLATMLEQAAAETTTRLVPASV